MDETKTIPRDEFSTEMRKLSSNPGAVRKQSIVEDVDFYGNVVTWVLTTFRADGEDTLLLQRQTADGSNRLVLPPSVTAVIARQRDGAVAVNRRRGARAAAATREAKGIRPNFGKKGK
jgi:hypothetical protein